MKNALEEFYQDQEVYPPNEPSIPLMLFLLVVVVPITLIVGALVFLWCCIADSWD